MTWKLLSSFIGADIEVDTVRSSHSPAPIPYVSLIPSSGARWGPLDAYDLNEIEPKIRKLAIIGITQAGKTTLRERLAFDPPKNERTQTISAKVVSLQTSPPTQLAILDGGGDYVGQQFRIAEACDCLCIVVDHNISDTEKTIDDKRIDEHREFLKQVRRHLDESDSPRKEWIKVLINKHDLWSELPTLARQSFEDAFAKEGAIWQQGKYAGTVNISPHSNDAPIDVVSFMSLLKATAS